MKDENPKTVESFDEFHNFVESFKKLPVVYRGLRKESYPLVPKIGRYEEFSVDKVEKEERIMLRLFKQFAVPFLTYVPKNDWEWMAIAQHHGLPTRLMDWTHNPLVAAYFAVEKYHKGDSVVYAYVNAKFIGTNNQPDPFAVRDIFRFIPDHITPRIVAQAGLFTVHPNPQEPFNSPRLFKLIIKEIFREKFKYILYKYGIHRATMFPGLDGLASNIIWRKTKEY